MVSSKKAAAGGTDWSKATSAAAGGGMDALVAAAKKEGTLNVITLPRTWANYGKLMDDFTAKYGIKINDANPDGSSGDEITALSTTRACPARRTWSTSATRTRCPTPTCSRRTRSPTWNDIPDRAEGRRTAPGTATTAATSRSPATPSKIAPAPCPTSFADLINPANVAAYKGKVAINGDPTAANAAFSAVYAAALANGGSLDNIQPGIDFFAKLKKNGDFNATQSSESTIEQGSTPIAIDWEFNNSQYAADLKAKGVNLTVVDPDRRSLLGLLRPGHQQVRAAPGRRPPVGGVPLLADRPERLHGRLRPPGRVRRRCRRPARSTPPRWRTCRRSPARRSSRRAAQQTDRAEHRHREVGRGLAQLVTVAPGAPSAPMRRRAGPAPH